MMNKINYVQLAKQINQQWILRVLYLSNPLQVLQTDHTKRLSNIKRQNHVN